MLILKIEINKVRSSHLVMGSDVFKIRLTIGSEKLGQIEHLFNCVLANNEPGYIWGVNSTTDLLVTI